jgi:hypothetical protein
MGRASTTGSLLAELADLLEPEAPTSAFDDAIDDGTGDY